MEVLSCGCVICIIVVGEPRSLVDDGITNDMNSTQKMKE